MDLNDYRQQLDGIDREILRLFFERMDVVTKIGAYKQAKALPVLDAVREKQKLEAVAAQSPEGLEDYGRAMFSLIMELSRDHQSRMMDADNGISKQIGKALAETARRLPEAATIACHGAAGANSRLACQKIFARPNISYFSDLEAVFAAVAKGDCRYGLIPVEGGLAAACELLKEYGLYIVSSLQLNIGHNLAALPGVQTNEVRELTRFLCFTKSLEIYPGADRTSLTMALPNRPGSLYRIVSRFYALGINIHKLDSRILPGEGSDYIFYFDLDTPEFTEQIRDLMGEIASGYGQFHYLGTYREVL